MASYPNFRPNNQLIMLTPSWGLPHLGSSEDDSSSDESSNGGGGYHGKLTHPDGSAPPAAMHPDPAAAGDADAELLINIPGAPAPEGTADVPQRKHRRGWSVRMRGLLAPKKLVRCRTPCREEASPPEGCGTIGLEPSPIGLEPNSPGAAAAMTPGSPSTPYDCVNEYRPTSSEQEPSPFQTELPDKGQALVHSKICALMGGYAAIHREFNFAMLSGVGRSTLKREYDGSTPEDPIIAGACHRDVVGQLLDCADDLVVEGFFREYAEGSDGGESERVEACLFSSESLRQIIVCFRGSTANQAKPFGKSSRFGKQATHVLSDDDKVPVMQTFHSSYFGTPLERAVFGLLGNLVASKPFFDVAMTGHSFGAAMAAIASVRYAMSNSQIRVTCNVFGSPRVGAEAWRQKVHSIPNLRVFRVENGSDPNVMLPNEGEWVHCGHAIKMADGRFGVNFSARRFDRDSSAIAQRNRAKYTQSKSRGRADREIESYVDCLSRSGAEWVEDFSDLKGDGASGADNERRTMA